VNTEEEEMCKDKALAKPYTCWSWYIIGAVLLTGLSAPAQVVERTAQMESMPPYSIASGNIKVSIVGNQVHIESSTPVMVYFKPLGQAPEVKLEPKKLEEKVHLSWRGPIIIAPTP
jgi:hypothetical protein